MDQEMLRRWLAAHNIDSAQVVRGPGIRLVLGDNKRIYFQVSLYAKNSEGARFIDLDTGDAAVETRMVPVMHLPS